MIHPFQFCPNVFVNGQYDKIPTTIYHQGHYLDVRYRSERIVTFRTARQFFMKHNNTVTKIRLGPKRCLRHDYDIAYFL